MSNNINIDNNIPINIAGFSKSSITNEFNPMVDCFENKQIITLLKMILLTLDVMNLIRIAKGKIHLEIAYREGTFKSTDLASINFNAARCVDRILAREFPTAFRVPSGYVQKSMLIRTGFAVLKLHKPQTLGVDVMHSSKHLHLIFNSYRESVSQWGQFSVCQWKRDYQVQSLVHKLLNFIRKKKEFKNTKSTESASCQYLNLSANTNFSSSCQYVKYPLEKPNYFIVPSSSSSCLSDHLCSSVWKKRQLQKDRLILRVIS